MGRTNEPQPVDFEALREWDAIANTEARDAAADELERLYRIESAALAVVSSMSRRNGKVYSPSLSTFEKLVALGECFEYDTEEEDDNRAES